MNWYVLYAMSNKTDKLIDNLNKKTDIEAFVPRYEYYRRNSVNYDIKPMFYGYIFVKSALSQCDFDSLLRNMKEGKDGFIRQLVKDGVSALSEEERDMFEKLLDENHVVRMSQAFLQDGKAKVYQGPLKSFEDNIIKVDKHNHVAYLNLTFMNRTIKASLMITGTK